MSIFDSLVLSFVITTRSCPPTPSAAYAKCYGEPRGYGAMNSDEAEFRMSKIVSEN